MIQEPYRYECENGHVSVVRRSKNGTPMQPKDSHWYCKSCGEAYDTVTDKKNGKVVRP